MGSWKLGDDKQRWREKRGLEVGGDAYQSLCWHWHCHCHCHCSANLRWGIRFKADALTGRDGIDVCICYVSGFCFLFSGGVELILVNVRTQ